MAIKIQEVNTQIFEVINPGDFITLEQLRELVEATVNIVGSTKVEVSQKSGYRNSSPTTILKISITTQRK